MCFIGPVPFRLLLIFPFHRKFAWGLSMADPTLAHGDQTVRFLPHVAVRGFLFTDLV